VYFYSLEGRRKVNTSLKAFQYLFLIAEVCKMTKGQVEAKISEVTTKFEINYMGRGPKQIKTKIVDDLIIIRLKGFLTPAEQKLAEKDDGVELIKKLRNMLFENAEHYFKDMIKQIIDIDIISIHSDVSTKTGEKIIVISATQSLEEKLQK
jgi:uncharacterized protein YbcI